MIKHEFMEVYQRDDLLQEARLNAGDAEAVFTQADVWTTHVFLLRKGESEGSWEVLMFEAHNEDKGVPACLEEIRGALSSCEDDSGEYGSLGEALDTIAEYSSDVIHGAKPEFTAALAAFQEREKIASMSKYARKRYLRELN